MKRRKKCKWTSDMESRLTRLWGTRATAQEIAESMSLQICQVRSRAYKLRLVKPRFVAEYPIVEWGGNAIAVKIPGAGGQTTWIDKDIYEWFVGYSWYAHKEGSTYYVIRSDHNKLHRLITAASSLDLVDHIDRNGLNNRKSNLRIATSSQNAHNSGPRLHTESRYKGVWLHKSGLYYGAIHDGAGRRCGIGYFQNEREAARAHDALARHFRGAFAFQNLPDDPMTLEEIQGVPALSRIIIGSRPLCSRQRQSHGECAYGRTREVPA